MFGVRDMNMGDGASVSMVVEFSAWFGQAAKAWKGKTAEAAWLPGGAAPYRPYKGRPICNQTR